VKLYFMHVKDGKVSTFCGSRAAVVLPECLESAAMEMECARALWLGRSGLSENLK